MFVTAGMSRNILYTIIANIPKVYEMCVCVYVYI